MKHFSDYEKLILKELIIIDDTPGALTVLGNVIDFELTPNFYIELKSENNCPVRISKTYIDKIAAELGSIGLNETIKQFNNKLLFIVKLFEYLEKEKLIHLAGELPITTLGTTFDVRETPVGYELEDKEIVQQLYYFARKKIVLDDELKQFVKNNFKTDMENTNGEQPVHDHKTHKATKWILWLTAIVVLLTALLVIDAYEKKTTSTEKGVEDKKPASPPDEKPKDDLPQNPKSQDSLNPPSNSPVEIKLVEPKKSELKKPEPKKNKDTEKDEIRQGVINESNK